jgi:hypothetical protein
MSVIIESNIKQIASGINPLSGIFAANMIESRTLASLRDLLPPKLMRGEVRVNGKESKL